MRERIESKHVTKEIKSQMPVIPVEIIKERGCTFCPYYLGSYEKQPRCMMKNCAWDDENERFHPVLRELIPFYKEKMEKAEEKFLAMKKIYTTLLGMFADEMKQEELEKDEITDPADFMVAPLIGNILVMINKTCCIKDDVVMDMIFINMGAYHIFIFSFQYFVCKLLP